ncbi:ATP-binding protein [Zobellia alginiliquefaciens]|uniref:ATP-binding protein n=1 Tax=Zobellia alginiliquefaciens TaxID=3032586 RepID=UPI0023E42275|nr:ATP-binding protein [Zobellia alginiliquefaciens]
MDLKKVVITGGPSTGKTSVIENLERKGYHCVHELIRSMTSSEKNENDAPDFAVNPIVSVKDPKKFNQNLLDGRIKQYTDADSTTEEIVFFDRGIPDVHAYMNCFGQTYSEAFEKPCYTYRYEQILLMPPWKEIHVVDNERFESFEEAERIYQHLKTTYEQVGYTITIVPTGTIEERTDFILKQLNLK